MKVFLTYEMNCGDLALEAEAVTGIRCYENLDKAIEHTIDCIMQGKKDEFLVDEYDEEIYDIVENREYMAHPELYNELFNAIKKEYATRNKFALDMFDDHQENFACYYTLIIEGKEVE